MELEQLATHCRKMELPKLKSQKQEKNDIINEFGKDLNTLYMTWEVAKGESHFKIKEKVETMNKKSNRNDGK